MGLYSDNYALMILEKERDLFKKIINNFNNDTESQYIKKINKRLKQIEYCIELIELNGSCSECGKSCDCHY